MYGTMIVA